MESNQKKLSFQILTLITTPKRADKAAEMFKQGHLPLQYRFNARERHQMRLWICLDSAV